MMMFIFIIIILMHGKALKIQRINLIVIINEMELKVYSHNVLVSLSDVLLCLDVYSRISFF